MTEGNPSGENISTPVRLRLSRASGFDLQAHSLAANGLAAVNVARPTAFGNPFVVSQDGGREHCVSLFEAMLAGYLAIGATPSVGEQRGTRVDILSRVMSCEARTSPAGAVSTASLAMPMFS